MESFKRELRTNFKIFAAVMLLLGIGSVSSVVSARHVNRHRITVSKRTHRSRLRIHRSRKIRRFHHRHRRSSAIYLRNHRYSKWAQISRNRSELYKQTILDINRDRRHHHLRALKIDHNLSKIGNQRSHQLHRYFSHNTSKHSNEVRYLLQRRHIKYNYYGENIASSPLGTIDIIAVGRYNNPNDAHQNRLVYHSHNGYQLANNIEDASMNHDKGDQEGHRANILDKRFKRIGVGTSYNPHDKNYYLAIEFIN